MSTLKPTPQQAAFLAALTDTTDHLVLRARAGCLTGGTTIGVNRAGKSYNVSIATLVHMMNGGVRSGRSFDPTISTYVRSHFDGVVKLAKCVSGIYSGVKEVWEVKTRLGNSIKATEDHRFLTPEGWVELADLSPGLSLLVDSGKGSGTPWVKKNYRRMKGMEHHPFAHSSHPSYCVWTHRLVAEAQLNRIDLEEFVLRLRSGVTSGLCFLDPARFEVHHKDNNTYNNNADNLEILTVEEHRILHAEQNGWRNVQANIIPDPIISIEFAGEDFTFDLTMEDESRPNFLGNGIVVHNCGKTSAILMGVDAYTAKFPTAEILVCAYNRAIADEVSAKLKAHGHTDWRKIQACTLHSLGFGLLKFIFKPEVDDKKVAKLVGTRGEAANIRVGGARTSDARAAEIFNAYAAQIIQLVRYAKQAGVGFFGDMQIGDAGVWYDLADHFDVNGFDDTTEMDKVIRAAQVIYRDSLNQTDVIDYDDMILIPLIKSLRVKFTKDVIFLDEAQDLSRARQALARKFIKPGVGRMIVVGDDRQAIYGFSGADSQALSNLTADLGAKVLPLSVTWRCPKAVVKVAQRFVPDLEAAETAPEGKVEVVRDFPSDLTATDAVLCRNTAPLITLAYEIIRSGKPCKVEGRSIGEGLIALARRWKVSTTPQLLDRLYGYESRETQKAMAKGNEQKAMDISDRVQTLREIVTAVNQQGKHGVEDVVSFIQSLFADGVDTCTTLATYHRSKGREWERVILYEHSERCPSKAARQQWQKDQEDNLAYVAFTRAKDKLVFYQPE